MALPLPKLDDRTFASLAEEAVRGASRRSPRWTDHNLHDPGITLLELFAWLAEQQHYYLDRIRDGHILKFLRLLGVRPKPPIPARMTVTLADRAPASPELDGLVLPRGTRFAAAPKKTRALGPAPPEVIFETVAPLTLSKNHRLEGAGDGELLHDLFLATSTRTEVEELSGVDGLGRAERPFYAFGDTAAAGNRLYLGFVDPLPAGLPLSLEFVLFEGYQDENGDLVLRGDHAGEPPEITPSGEITWEYRSMDGGEAAWLPLEILADDTLHLSLSGRLTFRGPETSPARLPFLSPVEPRHWLRATVTRAGYELPPRLSALRLNTVPAVEGKTWSEVTEVALDFTEALTEPLVVSVADPSALLLHAVAEFLAPDPNPDLLLVQLLEEDGFWRDRTDLPGLTLAINTTLPGEATVEVTLPVDLDPAKATALRLIALDPSLMSSASGGGLALGPLFLGKGNGLPYQSFPLPTIPVDLASALPESLFLLQVAEEVDPMASGEPLWRDWQRVEDFDGSAPDDRHYTLDLPAGRVRFGDGRNGFPLPPPPVTGEDNLRLLAFRTGGGEGGNLIAGAEGRLLSPLVDGAGLSVSPDDLLLTLDRPGIGGAEAESLDQADRRLAREMAERHRGVTDGDFEHLALETPGLRVARAKALPLFDPDRPDEEIPARVTVVVVPFSETAKPVPSPGFLETVCRHLDGHRLITTDLEILGPTYVEISVRATLSPHPGYSGATIEEQALDALDHFLDPLRGGPDGTGWPFGGPVHPSEIYQVLEGVPGVDCVETLALTASGPGVASAADGGFTLPPLALVCPGEHDLDVLFRETACRVKGEPR